MTTTFNILCKKHLVNNGLSNLAADNIMHVVRAAPENESMSGRWADDVGEYPAVMQRMVLLTINRYALRWIEQNCPDAWFKAMFDPADPIHQIVDLNSRTTGEDIHTRE